MQKNWSKFCSLLKSCKTKLSYQGLRFASLALMLMMSTGYAMADAGSSAITGAVGTFKGYIDPVRNLLYVIAAVVSIIGAFNVFYKMNNGDQDVKKTIMMTIGGCAALVAMAVALPKFFGY
jgi:hypothetical protein